MDLEKFRGLICRRVPVIAPRNVSNPDFLIAPDRFRPRFARSRCRDTVTDVLLGAGELQSCVVAKAKKGEGVEISSFRDVGWHVAPQGGGLDPVAAMKGDT